jgi:hypothetical protein
MSTTGLAELDAVLHDLLSRWHHWATCARKVNGFAIVAAGFSQYRPSAQWDSDNGAADDMAEHRTMLAVNRCIDDVPQPWRTALGVLARNLHLGVNVWHSPRLPANPAQRDALMHEASKMLARRLARAGVI